MRTISGQKLDGYVAADGSPIAILPMPPSWSPDTHQYWGHVKEKTSDILYICNCNAPTLQLHCREMLLYAADNEILLCRLGRVEVVENDLERHWKNDKLGLGGKV